MVSYFVTSRKALIPALVLSAGLMLSACSTSTFQGAAIGAAAGATSGLFTGDVGRGAAVGAASGAAGGFVAGLF